MCILNNGPDNFTPFDFRESPMITTTAIREYKDAQPFRPFRIHMASGKTYDIRHPELIMVLKNYVVVYIFAPGETDLPEVHHSISMMLMESLCPIDNPVTA